MASSGGRGEWIRTTDPLLPKQMRYQAALRPEGRHSITIADGMGFAGPETWRWKGWRQHRFGGIKPQGVNPLKRTVPLRRLPVAAFVCALAGLAAPLAFGQTAGGLRGTVLDDTGHPLPGAVVTLANERQASPGRGAVTGSAGDFQVASLPPAGDYVLTVRLAGFATVTLHDIEVPPGRFASLRVVLQPESR